MEELVKSKGRFLSDVLIYELHGLTFQQHPKNNMVFKI